MSNSYVDLSNYNTISDSYFYNGVNGTSAVTVTASDFYSNGLKINGRLEVDGKDIGAALEKIEERLAILVPDPAKLEKYEALRRAYEHYKLLEKLIGED